MRARRRVPAGRLVRLTLVLGAPAVTLLIALVLLGRIGAGEALGFAVLVLAGLALILWPLAGDLAAVAEHLKAGLDPAEISKAPELRFSEGSGEVASAAHQLLQRAERQVAEAKAAARANADLLDALPEPLLLVDRQRMVMRANSAARRLFGREVAPRPLTDSLRDPQVLEAVDDGLDRGVRREVPYTATGALERVFRVLVAPLDMGAEQGNAVLLLLHDITAMTRLERMRADFVANASHELRTPLTSILGFVETLQGPARDDPEARDRFLAIVHQQALRMKRLIEDLLSLSRIELREHTPPVDRVEVGQVLRSVAEALEIQAAEKGVTLDLRLPTDLPAVVGEADELAQVFQNLLTNAIKYGRAGSQVEVLAERVERGPASMPHARRGPLVAVRVVDHGEGIEPEHIPRLTERFYRVDTARSRQLGGTGLGLAIVKHIVNRHQGALTIDSIPGEGSTFSVFLPIWRDASHLSPGG